MTPLSSMVACANGLNIGEAIDFINWLSRLGDYFLKI